MRVIKTILNEHKNNAEEKYFFGWGNLTRDAELRETPNGKKVLNGGIAFTIYEGGKKGTLFLDFEAWDKLAENMNKFSKKGTPMIVHGEYADNVYTNKDGQRVEKKKLVVRGFQSILWKKDKKVEVSKAIDDVAEFEEIAF